MKDFLTIALIIVLLILGYFVFFTDYQDSAAQVQRLQDSITISRSEIARIERRAAELNQAMEERGRREIAIKREYERKIVVLKAKIRSQNSDLKWSTSAELDSLRAGIYGLKGSDTVYVMPIDQARDALITKAIQPLNDSLYAEQVARVEVLEKEKITQAQQLSGLIKLKDQELARERAINGYLGQIISEHQKDKKKAKFKRAIEKIGIGAAGFGIGFLLSK